MSKDSIAKEFEVTNKQIGDAVGDSLTNVYGTGIFDIAIDKAQKKIKAAEADWTGNMLHGFRTQLLRDDYVYFAEIWNIADYADAQNDGAEFDNPPPVGNLLPWVEDHMHYFQTNDSWTAAKQLSIGLYRNGLDAVRFMEAARRYLQEEGERDLEKKVNHRL